MPKLAVTATTTTARLLRSRVLVLLIASAMPTLVSARLGLMPRVRVPLRGGYSHGTRGAPGRSFQKSTSRIPAIVGSAALFDAGRAGLRAGYHGEYDRRRSPHSRDAAAGGNTKLSINEVPVGSWRTARPASARTMRSRMPPTTRLGAAAAMYDEQQRIEKYLARDAVVRENRAGRVRSSADMRAPKNRGESSYYDHAGTARRVGFRPTALLASDTPSSGLMPGAHDASQNLLLEANRGVHGARDHLALTSKRGPVLRTVDTNRAWSSDEHTSLKTRHERALVLGRRGDDDKMSDV
ncbi:hypothetical protein NFJ02_24g54070 [Pycnococcus provasolii]